VDVDLHTRRLECGHDDLIVLFNQNGEAILFDNDYFLQIIFCILFLTYSYFSNIDMVIFLLELFFD
jgi:hypothetical protein